MVEEQTKETFQQIAEGYQILFRHIVDDMKQERGGQMTMKEMKPYLLTFEEDMANVATSIFPSNEVRRRYVDMAFFLFNQGRYPDAKSAFMFLQQVILQDPGVLLGYGACLLMEGKREEAVLQFDEAEKLMPGYVQVSILKIRSYVEMGLKAAAQAALNSALDDARRQSDEDRRRLLVLVGLHFQLQTQ